MYQITYTLYNLIRPDKSGFEKKYIGTVAGEITINSEQNL